MEYHPPWLDGQKWAEETFPVIFPHADSALSLHLQPVYGSGAADYRVNMWTGETTSKDWRAARVELIVNAQGFGRTLIPVSWYVGDVTDFPTGIVRFQEYCGPRLYHEQHDLPAGVWALTFRRSA
jgi:hypothetical protein